MIEQPWQPTGRMPIERTASTKTLKTRSMRFGLTFHFVEISLLTPAPLHHAKGLLLRGFCCCLDCRIGYCLKEA